MFQVFGGKTIEKYLLLVLIRIGREHPIGVTVFGAFRVGIPAFDDGIVLAVDEGGA
jgi:hypothetical protein